MIARANQRQNSDTNERFSTLLPNILRVSRYRLRHQPRRDREELAAEALASAFVMYVSLVRRGRQNLAYPTPLATYGCRRALDGRRCGSGTGVRDVTSRSCRQRKGVRVDTLDCYDQAQDEWREVLVEDRHAGPAEIACCRIDFDAWLSELPRRERKIAERLSLGETTKETARRFRVSSGRISQIRNELRLTWLQFQGEPIVTTQTVGTTAETGFHPQLDTIHRPKDIVGYRSVANT